jgi:hypothetical protein
MNIITAYADVLVGDRVCLDPGHKQPVAGRNAANPVNFILGDKNLTRRLIPEQQYTRAGCNFTLSAA